MFQIEERCQGERERKMKLLKVVQQVPFPKIDPKRKEIGNRIELRAKAEKFSLSFCLGQGSVRGFFTTPPADFTSHTKDQAVY